MDIIALFGLSILVMVAWAIYPRFRERKRTPRSRQGAQGTDIRLSQSTLRDRDGHLLDEKMDARFQGAFNGLNRTLPFLGGQSTWSLGPPPPAASLEAEHSSTKQTLTEEELQTLSQPPKP